MSKGKYSPNLPTVAKGFEYFNRNAKGELPEPYSKENYNAETMLPNFDPEGYDMYGYSSYDRDGRFIGISDGVDRNGITEYEYMCMTDEEWEAFL